MELQEFRTLVAQEPAVFGYFSTPECRVCKVLRPRVEAMLAEHYPNMRFVYVDCAATPETAAQHDVLTVPTVVAWFGGGEVFRKVRHFGVEELGGALERPYGLLFED